MKNVKKEKVVSKYRQTGWKDKKTGVVHVMYGDEVPKDKNLIKVWDHINHSTLIKKSFDDSEV